MGKLLPILLAFIGLGAGVGAGVMLRPDPVVVAEAETSEDSTKEVTAKKPEPAKADVATDFVEMANQFVIPIVDEDAVTAMVVLSLTIEVLADQTDQTYAREPKLRDSFLRVLLDHANSGGFDGAFTSNGAMDALRTALFEIGQAELGDVLTDILILNINRQAI